MHMTRIEDDMDDKNAVVTVTFLVCGYRHENFRLGRLGTIENLLYSSSYVVLASRISSFSLVSTKLAIVEYVTKAIQTGHKTKSVHVSLINYPLHNQTEMGIQR